MRRTKALERAAAALAQRTASCSPGSVVGSPEQRSIVKRSCLECIEADLAADIGLTVRNPYVWECAAATPDAMEDLSDSDVVSAIAVVNPYVLTSETL